MHITNFRNSALGICAIALITSCSISTTLDSSLETDVEAAIKLKEEAKIPTKVANQDLIKVNDDIYTYKNLFKSPRNTFRQKVTMIIYYHLYKALKKY